MCATLLDLDDDYLDENSPEVLSMVALDNAIQAAHDTGDSTLCSILKAVNLLCTDLGYDKELLKAIKRISEPLREALRIVATDENCSVAFDKGHQMWGIFHMSSNFCFSLHHTKEEAEQKFEELKRDRASFSPSSSRSSPSFRESREHYADKLTDSKGHVEGVDK